MSRSDPQTQVDYMSYVAGVGKRLGYSWFDYQVACFEQVAEDDEQYSGEEPNLSRYCLYYKTGAGKSITALVMLALMGEFEAVVIAPPSTHDTWVKQGAAVNIKVTAMSHAKFRDKKTKLDRYTAVIADEMHLFGKNTGKGWGKLDALAKGLKAPMILASATPNYNDAERVYCIEHILNPNLRGGFLAWLYANCETEQDPYSMTPNVLGFLHYKDAAAYLAAMPGVFYLKDDLVYQIQDFPIAEKIPQEMQDFGYNRRKRKIISSIMEERHDRIAMSLIKDGGNVHDDVLEFVMEKYYEGLPLLVYANHQSVANALATTIMRKHPSVVYSVIHGGTTTLQKAKILDRFRAGEIEMLIGTASLATGTDGMDKVCDTLVIVDDTDDDSLRRQLIGRIMPRGVAASAQHKSVFRLVLQP